jgi:predicted NBD/HSP70 family sugar kinase
VAIDVFIYSQKKELAKMKRSSYTAFIKKLSKFIREPGDDVKPYLASDMRDLNRNSVFGYIASEDEVSRPMIAQATGISNPTVFKIVNFLIDEGLVMERGARSGTVGRKAQMLRFNKERYFAMGAVLEGLYLRTGIVNLAGEIVCSATVKAEGGLREIMTGMIPSLMDQLIQKSGILREQVLGIGLGLPCSYDHERHIAKFAPLIGIGDGLCILEMEQELSRRAGMPLVIDNDVNMAVFGEYRARGFKDRDFAYISVGSGLGAGIILEGKLRHGSSSQCGEIGYMTFENNYVASRNKAGWLEQSINLNALRERFGFTLEESSPEALDRVSEYVSNYIVLCITNYAAIMDCGTVCLGGILSEKLGDKLYKRVREQLDVICAINIDLETPILADAGVVGASLCIIDQELERILAK